MFTQKIFENLNDFITELKIVYKEDNIKTLQSILHKNIKFINIDTNHLFRTRQCPIDLYFTIWDADTSQLISVLKLSLLTTYQNLRASVVYTVMYVSTHNKYKQKGLSKQVIDMCFAKIKQLNSNKVVISPYTTDGFVCLKHIFYSFAQKYNLSIEDHNYISIHDK